MIRIKQAGLACVLAASIGVCLGQNAPQGEFLVYYSQIQGFDFDSGNPIFQIQDESFHGGGFGFTFNLNEWFGFWSQSTFYSGVEQNLIDLKLINQMQGAKLTARGLGPINLFGKGGMGFARFVFDTPQFETVRYGSTFNYGGGAEIQISDGMVLVLELTRLSLSLPDITGLPNRDKWDSSLQLVAGIGFQF